MVSLLLMVLVLVKSVKKVPTRLEAVLVGLRNFLHALGSLATSFLDSIEQIHGLTLTHGIGISQNPNARVFMLYSLGLSVSLYRLWMPTPK